MIWLGLRCAPAGGRIDLAWLAGLAGSLNEIHEFLLQAEISARLGAEVGGRALTPFEARIVVRGRATELGSPLVRIGDDLTRLRLGTRRSPAQPARALARLALLLRSSPELVAWPDHIKRAWFGEGIRPAKARRAHDWIGRSAMVEVIDTRSVPKRSAELPTGVFRAPPLTT